MKLRSLFFALGLLGMSVGFGQGLYLEAKAWLAQVLIEDSWQQALDTGEQIPPWPWADTFPVARLSVPALAIERMVLSGASGRVLAFGPGHITATAAPGDPGISMISGHRDTHFLFVKDISVGQQIHIQQPDGTIIRYRVVETWVQHQEDMQYLSSLTGDQLLLVTCYPFADIIPGTQQRYLVRAIKTAHDMLPSQT